MTDQKKDLVKEVAQKVDALPDDKKNYVLGVMNGMLISYDNASRQENGKS